MALLMYSYGLFYNLIHDDKFLFYAVITSHPFGISVWSHSIIQDPLPLLLGGRVVIPGHTRWKLHPCAQDIDQERNRGRSP